MKHFTLAVASLMVLTGCSSLENKAVAVGSTVDGAKLETTGSVSTATLLPNIMFGGANFSMATAPVVKKGSATQPVFVRTYRKSLLGELLGLNWSSETVCYIGLPGETSEQTEQRLNALKAVSTPSEVKDK